MESKVVDKFKYFRVSEYVSSKDDIQWFLSHLHATGVEACISKHSSGLAVWRTGVEAANPHRKANSEEMIGDIIEGSQIK